MVARRQILQGAGALAAGVLATGVTATAASAAQTPTATASGAAVQSASRKRPYANVHGPRARVFITNDLSGDIDGLFATVHALLSTSTDVRAIVGTFAGVGQTSALAADNARTILKLMALKKSVPVLVGSETKLADFNTPVKSAGALALVKEANRTDTKLPLYVTVGAALTDVASALMLDPSIASKMTVVWIGGAPYPAGGGENNFNEDPVAAQYVFNQTTVPLWQVTSAGYAQCEVSDTELEVYVSPYGRIGQWLYERLSVAQQDVDKYGLNIGETYTLGDSPLVLLTALTAWGPTKYPDFAYEGTSSTFDSIYAPKIASDGTYTAQTSGRMIRVYDRIDTRLLFSDFFAKLRANYPCG